MNFVNTSFARTPSLSSGRVAIRFIGKKDARTLEREYALNRSWLKNWEATVPNMPVSYDIRGSISLLRKGARAGVTVPFVLEYDGELVGQLTISSLSYGSVSSASLGYWIAERSAGLGITPTAVSLATDYCFFSRGLHRMEICIRPENAASLRVVQKLGFRYEGLRRKYIHINGDWRDHFCFALVVEDVPTGVLNRWQNSHVSPEWSRIPEADLIATRASA